MVYHRFLPVRLYLSENVGFISLAYLREEVVAFISLPTLSESVGFMSLPT